MLTVVFLVVQGISQNSVDVDVTAHSCCPNDGTLQGARNGFCSYGTQYSDPGTYDVSWVTPLFNYLDTRVSNKAIPAAHLNTFGFC